MKARWKKTPLSTGLSPRNHCLPGNQTALVWENSKGFCLGEMDKNEAEPALWSFHRGYHWTCITCWTSDSKQDCLKSLPWWFQYLNHIWVFFLLGLQQPQLSKHTPTPHFSSFCLPGWKLTPERPCFTEKPSMKDGNQLKITKTVARA